MIPHCLYSWLLAAALLVLPAARSYAADRSPAFETIAVNVFCAADVNTSDFHDTWTPKAGGAVEVETPFHLGLVRLGVHLFPNSAAQPGVPNFRAAFLYLGWGMEWQAVERLGLLGAVHVGSFYMDFDDDDTAEELQTESELGAGAYARVRYEFSSSWSVFAGAEYRRILTRKRIDYVFISAGVGRAFGTPRWLKGFLD